MTVNWYPGIICWPFLTKGIFGAFVYYLTVSSQFRDNLSLLNVFSVVEAIFVFGCQ